MQFCSKIYFTQTNEHTFYLFILYGTCSVLNIHSPLYIKVVGHSFLRRWRLFISNVLSSSALPCILLCKWAFFTAHVKYPLPIYIKIFFYKFFRIQWTVNLLDNYFILRKVNKNWLLAGTHCTHFRATLRRKILNFYEYTM